MTNERHRPILTGKKALVSGIANEHSIAYGCAKAFRELGAELAITYAGEKTRIYVEPLARELGAPIFMPLDVTRPDDIQAVFGEIERQWGRLDLFVHSIAWAPKDDLQGGLLDSSAEGFGQAMDISCHSFVRMARQAASLMKDGGTMFTMSYYGANKVVPNYNLMGPVKAALEACARYLAYELGPKRIRVHAVSPGPLKTRRFGPEGLRAVAGRCGRARPPRRAGRHHGCRFHLRIPGHAVCQAAVRGNHVRRWWRPHHGLTKDLRWLIY